MQTAIQKALNAKGEEKVNATEKVMRLIADDIIDKIHSNNLRMTIVNEGKGRMDMLDAAIIISPFGDGNDYTCEVHTPDGSLFGGFSLINEEDAEALDAVLMPC